jgi:hypothetical protein
LAGKSQCSLAMRTFVLVSAMLASSCGSTLIVDKGFSKTCSAPSDCTQAYFGEACSNCTCPNAAIATSSASAYQTERTSASSFCGTRPVLSCDCVQRTTTCTGGVCGLAPL